MKTDRNGAQHARDGKYTEKAASTPGPTARLKPLPVDPHDSSGEVFFETPDHWDVDDDAPSYYPENTISYVVTIEPGSALTATQRLLHAHPAFDSFDLAAAEGTSDDELPEIIAMGGVAYINDGHHRLAAAHAAGVPIRARVFTDPDEEVD